MEPTVSIIELKDPQEDAKNRKNEKKEEVSKESPKAETCCCCISLKKGAKIIGFTQILINGIVFCFSSILDFSSLKSVFDRKNKRADNSSEYDYVENEEEGFCGAHILELESLIMISIAVKLLIGVFKNKPNLIEHWYRATAELVLLSLILFATRAAAIYIISQTFTYIYSNLTEPLYHGTMCYFTWIVYKYYLSITRKRSNDDLSLTT